MRSTKGVFFLLCAFLQACAVQDLARDIDQADANYGYLKLAPIEARVGDSNILVVVFEHAESGARLIDYDMPNTGAESFFLVRIADYGVGAFEDINHDFIYQPGEPAAFSNDPPLYTGAARGEEGLEYKAIESLGLNLSSETRLPWAVDLSQQSPQMPSSRFSDNFLQVTSWDNPAFSDENAGKGLWQPMSFYQQTGYGLYLLEELDPRKQLLLLVHGINGSPLNFKALADALGERYQLLLFQYPSGFPLEHTAYILHRAVNEVMKRFTDKKIHVLAHSMGGLVSRGLLALNDAEANSRTGVYITLATPWSGQVTAQIGVEWSPVIAPVWRSMAPNSDYLQKIFSRPIASSVEHHLFFSFAEERDGPSRGDDGVVTVRSQLHYRAQEDATALYGIDDNHNGILSNLCVLATVRTLLAGPPVSKNRSRLDCANVSPAEVSERAQ